MSIAGVMSGDKSCSFTVDGMDAVSLEGNMINVCQNEDAKMKALSVELDRKKAELQSNEELRLSQSSHLDSQRVFLNELKLIQETTNTALQELKTEVEGLKEDLKKNHDKCCSYLEFLQSESQRHAQQFITAPQCYHLKKISKDIENYTEEQDNLKSIIQSEYEPEIAALISHMNKEPIVILEIPGNSPAEFTAKQLSVVIGNLNDNTLQLNHKLKQLRSELTELEREESAL